MLKFWKRKLNLQEPEVVRALLTSILFLIVFLYIDFYNVFLNHIGDLRTLILGLIGGLLSLLGFSITGIAIVISLFSAQDIKSIEDLKRNSYQDILETFKHFAYDMVINIVLFIITYILMLTDIPIPGKFIFYAYTIISTYLFLYILFYGWALLSNCIALSNLKKLISESIEEEKSKFDLLNELALEQLVEIIYRGSHLNAFPRDQYQIDLLLIKGKGIYLNQVPRHVRLMTMLDPAKENASFPMDPCTLREYCTEKLSPDYDVEIAFLEGPPTKLLAYHTTLKARKIAWVHTDLQNLHWTAPYYNSDMEERAIYNQFDKVVFVSEGAKRGFFRRFGGLSAPCRVIKNPTACRDIQSKAALFSIPHDSFCFCTVASLGARKGQSRLLHAMGRLFREGFRFHLSLVGAGDNLSFLKELAHVLEIYGYIDFCGFQDNPYPYMAGCDVIISSSISEGFPLVLCEALALGKPVIATRCTGNQDVLQDGRFGLLVDNTEEGLTEGMRRVLSDPELYADLKRKARAGTDSLEYDTIITQIQDLLNE